MPQRNLLILLLATAVSYACYVRGEQNPYARYVADGLAAIDEGALESVPDRELFQGAMDGMVGVLNRFFESMLEIAAGHGGVQMKFGGDAMLLYFGGERHAVRAAACGLAMQRAMTAPTAGMTARSTQSR